MIINQLTITFCSDLMRNKTLKARNSTSYTNQFLTINITIGH